MRLFVLSTRFARLPQALHHATVHTPHAYEATQIVISFCSNRCNFTCACRHLQLHSMIYVISKHQLSSSRAGCTWAMRNNREQGHLIINAQHTLYTLCLATSRLRELQFACRDHSYPASSDPTAHPSSAHHRTITATQFCLVRVRIDIHIPHKFPPLQH